MAWAARGGGERWLRRVEARRARAVASGGEVRRRGNGSDLEGGSGGTGLLSFGVGDGKGVGAAAGMPLDMGSAGPSWVLIFFIFVINKGGHKTDFENASLTEAMPQRHFQKPHPKIDFDCLRKWFCSSVGWGRDKMEREGRFGPFILDRMVQKFKCGEGCQRSSVV